jgi:peptide/nickel transport system permease protein
MTAPELSGDEGATRPANVSFDAGAAAVEDERFYYASPTQMMWWRFRRHKVALWCLIGLVLFYLVAIFSEFVAPYDPLGRFPEAIRCRPSKVRIYEEGRGFQWPFVYRMEATLDEETFELSCQEILDVKYPIGLFVRGWKYKLLGLIPADIHLFGVEEPAGVWLFGLDILGRDVFSRAMIGSRISLFIGIVGLFFTMVFGTLLGGISGFFGGAIDSLIQRTVDFLVSIPMLPVLMMLASVIPQTWPSTRIFFMMSILLSLTGWGPLARVVRGMMLSLREEDYALAAKVAGASDFRIITRQLLPGITSYLVMVVTINIPLLIHSEVALSYLGLGLRPPTVSWGIMLNDLNDISVMAHSPWLIIPALLVIAVTLLFNFVGDGVRDAVDPNVR